MMNILPNLKNLTFLDHNLRKFPEFTMEKYMVAICEIEDGPTHLVPLECARGLDKDSSLSLMNILHLGRNIEVNACVKQLFLSFHGGFLWLD